jgi:hypothetical protein
MATLAAFFNLSVTGDSIWAGRGMGSTPKGKENKIYKKRRKKKGRGGKPIAF